jgi:hypothetical protein
MHSLRWGQLQGMTMTITLWTPLPLRWSLQAQQLTQHSGRITCTSTWHSNRPFFTPTNIKFWTCLQPSRSMPVTRNRVNPSLGADADAPPPHSPNPRFLPRAQEGPTIWDLETGDVDVAAEVASPVVGGSAQKLPKIQIPYLAPKSVQTC